MTCKYFVIVVSLLLVSAAVTPATLAQHGGDMRSASAMAAHNAQGTVNKVDTQTGNFNTTHGPVPSLNWPPLTMNFRDRDKSALTDIEPGQKVEISIVQEGEGKFVVTEVKLLK